MNKQQTKNIILINKPLHWTSNDVVRKVKNTLNAKKVGHAGTLDPLASGLLILGIGSGTKQLNDLITNDKEYVATVHFNYYTDTYDNEGQVLAYQNKEVTICDILPILENMKNMEYWQVPPKYSAIKINGQKAYDLARSNKEVVIEPRLVHLYDYEILSFIDKELVIRLHVSKGFYVRSFAHDLGERINNYANLAGLVRTKIGEFDLQNAWSLEELKTKYDSELE